MRLTLVVLALTFSIGCGGRAAQIAVTADDTAFARLEQVKLTKDSHCDAGNIPASSCEALADAFVPLWDGYLVFNGTLASGTPLQNTKGTLEGVRAAANDFLAEVQKIQDGHWKTLLIDLVNHFLAKL